MVKLNYNEEKIIIKKCYELSEKLKQNVYFKYESFIEEYINKDYIIHGISVLIYENGDHKDKMKIDTAIEELDGFKINNDDTLHYIGCQKLAENNKIVCHLHFEI